MNNKLISVIIPVYNVAQYLPALLLSIKNQTYKNLEIIFIDDGSTDNSQEILKEFCLKNNCKLIIQQNGGVSAARNTGYKHSTGDLIYFCDSDDIISHNLIEKLADGIIDDDADVSCCSFKKFKKDTFLSFKKKNIKRFVLENNDDTIYYLVKSFLFDWMVWNKMFKRQTIESVFEGEEPFNSKLLYGEDGAFFLRIMSKVHKTSITKTKLYGYRKRSSSLVNQSFSNRQMTFIEHIKWYQSLAENYPKAKFIVYDRFAHQLKIFLNRMMKSNWNTNDIQYVFKLYFDFYCKSVKSKLVPWYRKIDLIFTHKHLKNRVNQYLKNRN